LAANNLQRAAFFSEEFHVKVHVTVRSSIPAHEHNRSQRLSVTGRQAGKVIQSIQTCSDRRSVEYTPRGMTLRSFAADRTG